MIRNSFPKLASRISSEKNRLWRYVNLDKVSMRGFRTFVDAEALKSKLSGMLGDFSSESFRSVSDKEREVIVQVAEQAMRHEFDLLGSGTVKNDPIDWHTDFKCGKSWGKKYYRDLSSIPGADIKMPWELSRCQHLLWLGEAYLITGEDRFAQEVIDELCWWIEDNPLMYSVNWKCSMDVAFRAVNWMFALNMISHFAGFNGDVASRIEKSLWQHGFFIRNNLEKYSPDSGNHYTSDLVGLLYIGVLFRETSRGRRWVRLSENELRKEVFNQVLPSGVHYERSVSYHRLMCELLSYPVYMMKRVGMEIGKDITDRLQAMYAYVVNYTKPNGLAPLVADNDDGRFVPFLRRDFRDHSYLNDPGSLENRWVSTGIGPLFCKKGGATALYEDAGVAIVHEGEDYLFINDGGYSKRPKENETFIGTHTHNDLLSFELSLAGRDIIVDPGTYLYTSAPEERNLFRATAKHNTILVDAEEQNGFAGPFTVSRNVRVGDLKATEGGSFEGEYTTLGGNMHHKRRFTLLGGECIIKDELTKNGNGHSAHLFFHFADGVIPVVDGEEVMLDNEFQMSFSKSPSGIRIYDDTISPSYGVLVQTKSVKVDYIFDDSIQVITRIKTYKND